VLRKLRWQIGLAVAGLAAIGLVVVVFSHRAFTDVPTRGGQMVEAVVGVPAVLNPLFAVDDAELDVASLLFCALTRPDAEQHVQPDLATDWTVSPDGLTYTFRIRPNAVFHDGQPVTADDVVFTANMAATIARDARLSVAASPLVRPWERVTAQKVDAHTVTFQLTEAYAPFLDATMLGILPRHLLADVSPADLASSRFSKIEPIGCGPYRLEQPSGLTDSSARLLRFDEHWNATRTKPYLDSILLKFYPTVEDAVAALGRQDVQAMGQVPAGLLPDLGEGIREYSAVMPGFGLVYLNNNSVLFSEKAVRQALSLATDRAGIASAPDLLAGQGQPSSDPIPAGSWAYDPDADNIVFDPQGASKMLEQDGWIDSDGDGTRDREGKPLRFRLGTPSDPVMTAIARKLRTDWLAVGADPEIEPLDQESAVRALSQRDFDAMLFSWELPQYDPDPYPLWHSSQADQGQNYASFRNEAADKAMVDARRLAPTADSQPARMELFKAFQEAFAEDQPSLVLYHPVYSYVVVDPNLGGVQLPQLVVQPSNRYLTLSDWFVQTARVFQEEGGGS
jgi:peptide/nickel transport system substrate-binding protein